MGGFPSEVRAGGQAQDGARPRGAGPAPSRQGARRAGSRGAARCCSTRQPTVYARTGAGEDIFRPLPHLGSTLSARRDAAGPRSGNLALARAGRGAAVDEVDDRLVRDAAVDGESDLAGPAVRVTELAIGRERWPEAGEGGRVQLGRVEALV